MTSGRATKALIVLLGCILVATSFTGTLHAAVLAAPEIDAGTLSGGLALLAGGYLILLSRNRRK